MVWGGGKRVIAVRSRDIVGDSGDYRRGCALAELRNVAAGTYTLVCSTFEAGQIGDFKLRVASMIPCEVKPIPGEETGRLRTQLPMLVFREGNERLLAPVFIERMTKVKVLARCGVGTGKQTTSRPLVRIALEKGQGPHKSVLDVSEDWRYSDAPGGARTSEVDLSPAMSQQGGLWIVVERLGDRAGFDEVHVEVLSETAIKVGAWGMGDG